MVRDIPSLSCWVEGGRVSNFWSPLHIRRSTLPCDSCRGLGRWLTTICSVACAKGSHSEQMAHNCTLGSLWREYREWILSCKLLMILSTLTLSLHNAYRIRITDDRVACSETYMYLLRTDSYTAQMLSSTNWTNNGFFPFSYQSIKTHC